MPYRFAFLLAVGVSFARLGLAQENTQHVPAPSIRLRAASVCSQVPAVDTDSGAYNSGFKDGYKAGCKYALSSDMVLPAVISTTTVSDRRRRRPPLRF